MIIVVMVIDYHYTLPSSFDIVAFRVNQLFVKPYQMILLKYLKYYFPSLVISVWYGSLWWSLTIINHNLTTNQPWLTTTKTIPLLTLIDHGLWTNIDHYEPPIMSLCQAGHRCHTSRGWPGWERPTLHEGTLDTSRTAWWCSDVKLGLVTWYHSNMNQYHWFMANVEWLHTIHKSYGLITGE